jgi:hypothetical protein
MRRRGYQHYEIWDPVDGLLEEGTVAVKDMVTSQPWLDGTFDFPVVTEGGAVSRGEPVPVGGAKAPGYSPSR